MLQVDVALPSGKRKHLSIAQSSKVGDLRILAQDSFGKRFLRLVTANGHALSDLTQSLESAGLQDGDHLTAVAQRPKLTATQKAFALWCPGDSGIFTWGDPDWRGDWGVDSSAVQERLNSGPVQQVQATFGAFAAILADGSRCYMGRSSLWWR